MYTAADKVGTCVKKKKDCVDPAKKAEYKAAAKTRTRLQGSGVNVTNGCGEGIKSTPLNMTDEDEDPAGRAMVAFDAPAGSFGLTELAGGENACSSRSTAFEMQPATDTERDFGPFMRFCLEEVGHNGTGSASQWTRLLKRLRLK